MTEASKKKRSRLAVMIGRIEAKFPPLFGAGLLVLAGLMMAGHYWYGQGLRYPDVDLGEERLYWVDMRYYVCLPLALWLAWKVVSLGHLHVSKMIMGMVTLLAAWDVIFYAAPEILKNVEHWYGFSKPVAEWPWLNYWSYYRYWMPVVVIGGNLLLLRRWWRLVGNWKGPREPGTQARAGWGTILIEGMAMVTATAAILVTGIHLGLPRFAVNNQTVPLAETFLVQSRLQGDFEYLVSDPANIGKELGALLDHVELADLQRHQFYPSVSDELYHQYMLSPKIEPLPLNELNWRRTLWENLYPRVRHESDPAAAARMVALFLRQRIGINPAYSYRVGVETIWTEQMTDEAGFDRLYVAGLRSVGVLARLDEKKHAELFADNRWQPAPRPVISSF